MNESITCKNNESSFIATAIVVSSLMHFVKFVGNIKAFNDQYRPDRFVPPPLDRSRAAVRFPLSFRHSTYLETEDRRGCRCTCPDRASRGSAIGRHTCPR